MTARNLAQALVIPDSLLAKEATDILSRTFHRSTVQSLDPRLPVRD